MPLYSKQSTPFCQGNSHENNVFVNLDFVYLINRSYLLDHLNRYRFSFYVVCSCQRPNAVRIFEFSRPSLSNLKCQIELNLCEVIRLP